MHAKIGMHGENSGKESVLNQAGSIQKSFEALFFSSFVILVMFSTDKRRPSSTHVYYFLDKREVSSKLGH